MLFSLYFYLILFLRLPYILLSHVLRALLSHKRYPSRIHIVVQESLCIALTLCFVAVCLLHLKGVIYYYKLVFFVGHLQLNVTVFDIPSENTRQKYNLLIQLSQGQALDDPIIPASNDQRELTLSTVIHAHYGDFDVIIITNVSESVSDPQPTHRT